MYVFLHIWVQITHYVYCLNIPAAASRLIIITFSAEKKREDCGIDFVVVVADTFVITFIHVTTLAVDWPHFRSHEREFVVVSANDKCIEFVRKMRVTNSWRAPTVLRHVAHNAHEYRMRANHNNNNLIAHEIAYPKFRWIFCLFV